MRSLVLRSFGFSALTTSSFCIRLREMCGKLFTDEVWQYDGHRCIQWWAQPGLNGTISPINGLIWVISWGYNPASRAYKLIYNWLRSPPCICISICGIKRCGLLRTRQRGLHSMGPKPLPWFTEIRIRNISHWFSGAGLGVQMRAKKNTSALEAHIFRKRIGYDGQISVFHNRFQQIRDEFCEYLPFAAFFSTIQAWWKL